MILQPPYALLPGCHPLGSRYFPIYWVGVDPPVLVEGGVSAVIPILKRQMEDLYLSSPKRIILLHEHFDHVLGVPLLKGLWPQIKIEASDSTVSLLSKENIIKSYRQTDTFCTRVLKKAEEGEDAPWETYPQTETLNTLDLPPGIHIISTPGHSPGSMALFWEKEGILFTSDSVGYFSSKGSHFPLFFQNFQLYINSIEKLRALQPRFLALGHLHYFTGEETDKAFQRALKEAFRFREKVKKIGESGLKEVFTDIYQEELTAFYPKETIWECARLLVKRSLES